MPTKIIPVICPSCGGQVSPKATDTLFTCPYCGQAARIVKDHGKVSLDAKQLRKITANTEAVADELAITRLSDELRTINNWRKQKERERDKLVYKDIPQLRSRFDISAFDSLEERFFLGAGIVIGIIFWLGSNFGVFVLTNAVTLAIAMHYRATRIKEATAYNENIDTERASLLAEIEDLNSKACRIFDQLKVRRRRVDSEFAN